VESQGIDQARDQGLVAEPGRAGDPGDHAIAIEGRQGFDFEDELVVAGVEHEIDPGDATIEAEGGGGSAGEVLDAVAATPWEIGRAGHLHQRAVLVALDLGQSEDSVVEQDHLDLAPVHRALEDDLGVDVEGVLDGGSDPLRGFEPGDPLAVGAATGLDDTGPTEELEGAFIGAPTRTERDSRGYGEVVIGEQLARTDLVERECRSRARRARKGEASEL